MARETDSETELSQVPALSEVRTKPELAYEMRLAGKSPHDIAAELGYENPTSVHRAIQERFKQEAEQVSTDDRQTILDLENARLDALLNAAWGSAMYGDLGAMKFCLDVVKERVKTNQLNAVDTQAGQQTILVIGGSEDSYVEKLKQMADD